MKRFLLILLSATLTTNLSAFAPLELEEKAQQWIFDYATGSQESKAFSLSLEQTELLATALFHSYKLLKLDELAHTCNRITIFFHKVLPANLKQEHNIQLSATTVASFSAFIANGKQDLLNMYAIDRKNFETALAELEAAHDAKLVHAYNSVKETAYASIETWSKQEGAHLWQAALNELTEEQTKILLTFFLDPQLTQEKVGEMLAQLPLENLENFFTFQTEAHNFIKSIWQTYLITLIESAEKAGFNKIRLRGVQEQISDIVIEASRNN
jgi:hypothetical protein